MISEDFSHDILQGIYCIKFEKDSRKLYYVGSAVNLLDRFKKHKSDLCNNKHHSVYLQRAWNKYGPKHFKFCVLETVLDKNLLIEREQEWINKLRSFDKNHGFNMSPSAGSILGMKLSEEAKRRIGNFFKGKPKSKSQIRKISEAMKGKPKSEEHKRKSSAWKYDPEKIKVASGKISQALKGKKRSEQHRLNISKARRGKRAPEQAIANMSVASSYKLSENDVIEIKKALISGKTKDELALNYDVGRRHIWAIETGRVWKHVKLHDAKSGGS